MRLLSNLKIRTIFIKDKDIKGWNLMNKLRPVFSQINSINNAQSQTMLMLSRASFKQDVIMKNYSFLSQTPIMIILISNLLMLIVQIHQIRPPISNLTNFHFISNQVTIFIKLKKYLNQVKANTNKLITTWDKCGNKRRW